MPNIETPEDEEILQFLNNLADYCIPMDGGKMRMTSQVWPIVKARDAQIRQECESKWISVKERLPEALERVLVFYVNDLGKNRIDIGQHIPSKTVLAEDFLDENAEGCSEYDSGNDCYWVIEGWWEDSWQAEVNYKIHDVVTHWMPLPEPPVGKEGEE